MKTQSMMSYESLKRNIYAEAHRGTLEILREDENSITVADLTFGGDEPKEFTFTDPSIIDVRWLRRHIWIHPSITNILLDEIASALMEMDPNTFITLRHLIILPQLENLSDYVEVMVPAAKAPSLLDTAPRKFRNKNEPVGQLWNQANCAIVYFDNVKKAAAEAVSENLPAWESLHMCAWETIFHELRHLMLDCNPFLPESDYPTHLSSEEEVEEFCREEYDRIFGF